MANTFKTKAQLIDSLRSQLSTNPKQAVKALVILFNRQTSDEQIAEHTRYMNFVGFNHNDAKILTSIAKQYISGVSLTESQMSSLLRLIPKYAKQLVNRAIANGTYHKENGCWVH